MFFLIVLWYRQEAPGCLQPARDPDDVPHPETLNLKTLNPKP